MYVDLWVCIRILCRFVSGFVWECACMFFVDLCMCIYEYVYVYYVGLFCLFSCMSVYTYVWVCVENYLCMCMY